MNHELPPFGKPTEDKRIMNDDKVGGRGVVKGSGKAAVKVLSARGKKKNEETNPPPATVTEKIEFDDEKAAEGKRLLMWVGVSCLMVIFFVIWIFSLKYEFKASMNKNAGEGFNWSQAKVELDKAMTQVKQGLNEVKKIQENLKQKSSPGEPRPTSEQINLLKGKLLNEVATGTASSSRK